MKNEIIKKIHNFLQLKDSNSSFVIGSVDLYENHEMVIEIMENYYKHIKSIHNKFEKDHENLSYEVLDWDLYRKASNMILKKLFPSFSHFKRIYSKELYRNRDFDECMWYPDNEDARQNFISQVEFTKENYIKLIEYYGPAKIKKMLNEKIPINFEFEYLSAHSFTVARSGSGKSVLILEIMKSIIKNKTSSLILIEPHGDLSDELASFVDAKDLVYIDPFLQKDYIPTINIFEIEDKSIEVISIYTGVIVDVFKQIIGGAFSPAMQSLLTPMVAVLLQIPDSSFFDMLKFLDDSNNKELLKYAQEEALNPAHRLYFKTQFLESRASATKYSIATKLQVLLQDPIFANMLTGKSTIDLEKMINTKGKVIIIRLNTVKMTETIAPIGKFLTSIITAYAFKREHQDINSRVMTHFFIDEAPVFLGNSISMILEQARKFGLSLHLVSQNNHQLGTDINTSVLSNTSLKFVGINSNKNHRIMSSEIAIPIEELDALRNKGEFYVKIGTNKAFGFRVFYQKKETGSQLMYNPILDSMTTDQIERYYRKVDLSDIQYANIPEVQKVKEETKPYSKQSSEELLSKIDNDVDDDELLDY